MPVMIVTTQLPPRLRATTGTTTLTTAIAITVTTTFKIPSHQVHHQIRLKIYPLNQSTGEWKQGTTLIVEDSMIAVLTEANFSRNRKVKVHFLPGAKTEDLMFRVIPYLNKKPDNIIMYKETNNGPYSNEKIIY